MKNVTNIINANGNKVPNQFKIRTDKGVYFQSYNSIICFIPNGWEKPILGGDWDYSRTTLRHLKTFLCEEMRGLSTCDVSFTRYTSKKDIQRVLKGGGFRYIENFDLSTDTNPPKVDFKRVNNDINGNPRYVCHFLNFAQDYDKALSIAREMGGKKFHNKQYGGGIVFQSYNINKLGNKILELQEVN